MKKVILVIGVLIGFYSCNKVDETVNPQVTSSSYLPMAVGNYWIYQDYWNNGDGVFHASSSIDSTCIVKDTVINGRIFYKFDNYHIFSHSESPLKIESTFVYSDSAKHLINPKGEILFSENNFTDVLYKSSDVLEGDTATWLSFKMEKLNQSITVPAGTFTDLLNVKGTVICSPKFTNIPNPRYVNRYYAKNIGKIMRSSIYVQSGGVIEQRLLRYNLKK